MYKIGRTSKLGRGYFEVDCRLTIYKNLILLTIFRLHSVSHMVVCVMKSRD